MKDSKDMCRGIQTGNNYSLKGSKILMITESHFPRDIRVYKEAKELIDAGAKVDIIALRQGEEPVFEILEDIEVHRLPLQMHDERWLGYICEYLTFFVFTFLKLRKLYKRKHFDIIHVHTMPDFLVFASWSAKRKGARIILDLHELMPEFYQVKFNVSPKNLIVCLLRWIEKRAILFADGVITVTDKIKEILENRTKRNDVVVLMNTVDPIQIKNRIKSTPRNSEHKEFRLIYHGHINSSYDLKLAVNSVNYLKNLIPDLRFDIYGVGPYFHEINCLINNLGLENQITMHGWVSKDEVYREIFNSDVGLIPVHKNFYMDLSFSNRLADYVALNIPVIATRLDTYQHYFNDNAVLYFEPEKVDDLSEKIRELYEHPDRRHQMAENAYQKYQSIAWPIMRERLLKLVKSLSPKHSD